MNSQQSEAHKTRVKAVQAEVRAFYESGQQARIYHGASNSTRALPKGTRAVDASGLDHILEINESERYAVVEPNVALDQLLAETLKFGLTPLVVAEFPGITVGGAVQGGSGESSSFKAGGFHDGCAEYEIILGNGELAHVSREEHEDLFWGTACSYGSLGVMTKVTLRLASAKAFVKLRYQTVTSFDEAVAALKQATSEKIDFVDGIMFSAREGVIMTGILSEMSNKPIARFSTWHDEWFYLHAKSAMEKDDGYEELIPLKDYLFRYDRGGFWVAKLAFDIFHMPFNRLTRLWFSSLFKTRRLYTFLHGSNFSQRYVVQDICVPQQTAVPFLEFVDQEYGIYPLWLCPLKPAAKGFLSPNHLKTDLVIDVGIWGNSKESAGDFLQQNRRLEQQMVGLGGRKVLYAHSYHPESEFWHIYDRKQYDSLRKKYHADKTFPDIYTKTQVRGTYHESLMKGWAALLRSPYKK